MGNEKLLVSFFKKSAVDYVIEKNGMIFPCLFCCQTLKICTSTTNWQCERCEIEGNLKTLMTILSENKEFQTVRIYNAKREKNEIKKQFQALLKKEKVNLKDVEILSSKVNKLIDYLEAN